MENQSNKHNPEQEPQQRPTPEQTSVRLGKLIEQHEQERLDTMNQSNEKPGSVSKRQLDYIVDISELSIQDYTRLKYTIDTSLDNIKYLNDKIAELTMDGSSMGDEFSAEEIAFLREADSQFYDKNRTPILEGYRAGITQAELAIDETMEEIYGSPEDVSKHDDNHQQRTIRRGIMNILRRKKR